MVDPLFPPRMPLSCPVCYSLVPVVPLLTLRSVSWFPLCLSQVTYDEQPTAPRYTDPLGDAVGAAGAHRELEVSIRV